MRQVSLSIIVISILVPFFIKEVVLDSHIENVIKQFNSTDFNDTSSLDPFKEKEFKEALDNLEKEFGEINITSLLEKVDRKKVFYFLEDEGKNKVLNGMIVWKSYESLCLGKMSPPIDVLSKLKCRYIDRGNPFLKIAPFKEEEAYLEPRIVLFHDAIYDHEIETIITLAKPKLERAVVTNDVTGEETVMEYRNTETAWLDRTEHKDIEAVNRRIQLMTGLTLETAELLQVAYYPLGGRYDPHFDIATVYPQSNVHSVEFNVRIATVLLYLNNVEKGGATVFPKLDVSFRPKKGSAAFWYNLKPNGNRDYLTYHAACPVTSEPKWAANLWIGEEWQEFHRPCTLENQPRDEEWELFYLKT